VGIFELKKVSYINMESLICMRKLTVFTTHPTNRVAVHSITRETINMTPNVTVLVKILLRNTWNHLFHSFIYESCESKNSIMYFPMNGE
jgi:hypothetical protein